MKTQSRILVFADTFSIQYCRGFIGLRTPGEWRSRRSSWNNNSTCQVRNVKLTFDGPTTRPDSPPRSCRFSLSQGWSGLDPAGPRPFHKTSRTVTVRGVTWRRLALGTQWTPCKCRTCRQKRHSMDGKHGDRPPRTPGGRTEHATTTPSRPRVLASRGFVSSVLRAMEPRG